MARISFSLRRQILQVCVVLGLQQPLVSAAVPEWMVVSEEFPEPVVGTLLEDVGVRLTSARKISAPSDQVPVGKWEFEGIVVYAEPAAPLCQAVLADQDVLVQVRFGPGVTQELAPRERACVRGVPFIVARYEWECFDIPDTRRDFAVLSTLLLPSGDRWSVFVPS